MGSVFRALISLFLFVTFFQSTSFANSLKCEAIFNNPKSIILSPLESAENFRRYFTGLNDVLIERSEVLRLIQVALIAQEHVLLMGPPGNAKSMVADMVLGGIVDGGSGNNSYYRIQMTPETSMSETHGPINPKEIFESGKIVREYDQGMLFSRNVFIDEIFDARANAQRNILGLLAERQHAQGTEIVPGQIETVIGATNRYLDEVYEKAGDQGPKALLDRFSFNIYVPGEFELSSSYSRLISSAKKDKKTLPKLTFEELETLRSLVPQVEVTDDVEKFLSLLSFQMKSQTESMEQADLKSFRKKTQQGENPPPPYRATKYHSPRTLFKAAGILKALVVFDWIQTGGTRPLRATIEDIKLLKEFFVLSGPNLRFVEAMLERTSNPYERSQLSTIVEESKIFDEIYRVISEQTNNIIYQYALENLEASVRKAKTQAQKEQVTLDLVQIWIETRALSQKETQAEISGQEIGYAVVASYVEQKLRELSGPNFEAFVKQKVLEIEEVQKKALEEEKKREEEEQAVIEQQARELVANQKRAEMDAKIDDYLRNQNLEALKYINGNFLKVAQISSKRFAPESAGRLKFTSTSAFKIKDTIYCFETGPSGYKIDPQGKVTVIDYSKLGDPNLKDLLISSIGRKIEVIDDSRILLTDSASIAVVISLPDLKVLKSHDLLGSSDILLSYDKKSILQVWSDHHAVKVQDLISDESSLTNIVGLNSYNANPFHRTSAVAVPLESDQLFVLAPRSDNTYIFDVLNLKSNADISWNYVQVPSNLKPNGHYTATSDTSSKDNMVYVSMFEPNNTIVVQPINVRTQMSKDVELIKADPLSQTVNFEFPPNFDFELRITDVMIGANLGSVFLFEPSFGLFVYDVKNKVYLNGGQPLTIGNENEKIVFLKWLDADSLIVKSVDESNKEIIRILKMKTKSRSEIEKVIRQNQQDQIQSTPSDSE